MENLENMKNTKLKKMNVGGIYNDWNGHIFIYMGMYNTERCYFVWIKEPAYSNKEAVEIIKKEDLKTLGHSLVAIHPMANLDEYGYLGIVPEEMLKPIKEGADYLMSLPVQKRDGE